MRLPRILQFIAYQATWFITLLLAAHGQGGLGCLCALLITAGQLACAPDYRGRLATYQAMAWITLGGCGIDTLLVQWNYLHFTDAPYPGLTAPFMVGLWVSFAFSVCYFLGPYLRRYGLMTLLCALGFPLAYAAGAHLGAATLPQGIASLIAIGLGHAVMLPLLCYYVIDLKET